MKLTSESDIKTLVENDKDMMRVLRIARDFGLPDWWIGAGFLRCRVWDEQSGFTETTGLKDVDVVYFNGDDVQPETDWQYDKDLLVVAPDVNWEVRNQARMHCINGNEPFTSTEDGIAHWTETATAVAVKLDGEEVKLLFCYGSDDLLNIVARPTPYFTGVNSQTVRDRIEKKQWRKKWPMLQIKDL